MNKHLRLSSTHINNGDPKSWFYEEPRGICVVVYGAGMRTIPWKKIERALLRKKGTVDYTAPTKWDAK